MAKKSATKEYNPLEHSIVQACMKADAWHRYEVSDYVEALLQSIADELRRVYWNIKQEQLDDRQDREFLEITGFEYRRYFWDDCDCGAESPVHAKDCRSITEFDKWNSGRLEAISDPMYTKEEIEAERAKGTSPFGMMHMYMSRLSFDPEREKAYADKHPRPPCTCGASASWKPRDEHLPTCSPTLPNMKFGAVIINWYKRLGRGTSTNVDWDEKQWRKWFDGVMSALRAWEKAEEKNKERRG